MARVFAPLTRFLLAAVVLFLLAVCLAAPVSAQLPSSVPSAPTAVTATPGNGSITLNWGPPASSGLTAINSYLIQCGPNSARPGGIRYTWTMTNLINGTAYTCNVSAYNSQGRGAIGYAPSVTPVGPPSPPAGLTVAPGSGQAAFTWVAPSSNGGSPITGYTVTSNPGGLTCATTGTLSCTITGLTDGTLYSYTATATNSRGTSGPSSAVSGTPGIANTVPGAPTGLTATLLTSPITLPAGSVQLTWVAPASNGGSSITGYTLTTSAGGKSCSTTGALSCSVSGLSPNTSYPFTVTATNSVGVSPAATLTFVTPDVPGAPTALTATPGNGSITVNWATPASDGGTAINSYLIQCGPNGAHPGGVRNTWTISNLANLTAYTCYVRAYNAMGQGAMSSPISATPRP